MASVTQGIIDFALAPPIGVMNTHLDGNGPYASGNHTNTTWLNSGVLSTVANTFGMLVNFNGSIPPKLGLTVGYSDGGLVVEDVYESRLLQVVIQHQLLSGVWVPTQVEEIFSLPFVMRWVEALPGRVGLYIAPGIAVDLFYLLVA